MGEEKGDIKAKNVDRRSDRIKRKRKSGRGVHSWNMLCLKWGLTEFILSQNFQYLGQIGAPVLPLSLISCVSHVVSPAQHRPTLFSFTRYGLMPAVNRQGSSWTACLLLANATTSFFYFLFALTRPYQKRVEHSQRRMSPTMTLHPTQH